MHNSSQKPFGRFGYELIRVLALEFSLRTRTEAICLRAELLRREFKVDSTSIHVVSDLVRMIQVAINNYERLADTLLSGISREDLRVTSSDLALLFIRNLPTMRNSIVCCIQRMSLGRHCRRQVSSMSDNKNCMLSWGHFQDGLCMEFQMNRVIQTKLEQNGRRQWMLLEKVEVPQDE